MAALVLLQLGVAHAGELKVGDALPDVRLPTWSGQEVALTSLRGKVLILDFWASWCTVCRQALPRLDAIARRHHAAGLETVAINIDTNRDAAQRFLAQLPSHQALTLLRDPGGNLMARFGARGMPALYLVDRHGIVRLVEAGYTPDRLDVVDATITRLLGQPSCTPRR